MLTAIIIHWLMCSILMGFVWLWYLQTQNPGVVDVGWVACFMLVATTGFVFGNGSKITTAFILVMLWGLRLGGHLYFTRIAKNEVDKRYLSLAKEWKNPEMFGFFWNYQLQALLAISVAFPLIYLAYFAKTPLTLLDNLLVMIALAAIMLEGVADWQLYQFKQQQPNQPNHKKTVCNSGLWKFSRHPNYFFEWVFWLMIAMITIESATTITMLLSPLALFLIMYYLTIPITEQQSLESRHDAYQEYQRNTPIFFPGIHLPEHNNDTKDN